MPKKKKPDPPPQIIESSGVTPADLWPDEDDVYSRAIAIQSRVEQHERMRRNQFVAFNRGPVCIVYAADHHLGNPGTDVKRIFEEAEIIRDTPGMYAGILGDLLDNFVIGRLRQVRDSTRLSIEDEWVLVKRYLRIIGPKLLFSVRGNHERWTETLSGIDYFADVLGNIRPGCIYDKDDSLITINANGIKFPTRLRHKWRGYSYLNPTHGIERAFREDQNFVLGVGAHTHVSGLARDFSKGGKDGLAVILGSYKRYDRFAKEIGAAMPNNNTAVAVIFDDKTESMTGVANLQMAARLMRMHWT